MPINSLHSLLMAPASPDDDSPAAYSVQEAAEISGVSSHTLRYYERAGLLDPVARMGPGSHRRYTLSDLRRIEFCKRMRATGMPIQTMRRYVGLLAGGETTLAERKRILEAHRAKICAHIAEQETHLRVLNYKIANYACMNSDVLPPPPADFCIGPPPSNQTKVNQ